jgi:hypothetical protein
MANLIRKTERFAYVRLAIPVQVYEALLERYDGRETYALRTIRLRLAAALADHGAGNAQWADDGEPRVGGEV